jgi:hypothetical protein
MKRELSQDEVIDLVTRSALGAFKDSLWNLSATRSQGHCEEYCRGHTEAIEGVEERLEKIIQGLGGEES